MNLNLAQKNADLQQKIEMGNDRAKAYQRDVSELESKLKEQNELLKKNVEIIAS